MFCSTRRQTHAIGADDRHLLLPTFPLLRRMCVGLGRNLFDLWFPLDKFKISSCRDNHSIDLIPVHSTVNWINVNFSDTLTASSIYIHFLFLLLLFRLQNSIFQMHFFQFGHTRAQTMRSSRSSYFYWLHCERRESEREKNINCRERDRMCTIFRVRSFKPPRFACRTHGRNINNNGTNEWSTNALTKREITTTETKHEKKKSWNKIRLRLKWQWLMALARSTTAATARQSGWEKNGLFEAERGQMSMFWAAHGKLLCTDEIGDEWKQQQHDARIRRPCCAVAIGKTYL